MDSVLDTVSRQGFCLAPGFLQRSHVLTICESLADLRREDDVENENSPRRGGLRQLLDRAPQLRPLADSPALRSLVEPVLGPSARVVRATLFDKTPEANWIVPWHQDLTIAVQQRVDLPGFGPWSTKDGVCHVQPPTEVLENMLAVRIHLDDCDADNGALRVLPGSHLLGKLGAQDIRRLVAEQSPVTCAVSSGGAMLMRPLLLHASSKALNPKNRRVIHFEFASGPLPEGLQWQAHEATIDSTVGTGMV